MENKSKCKFECIFCEKRFRLYSQLETHMNLHTGERPYFCPACEMTYPSVQELHRHCESAHDCIRFKCSKCQRLFQTYEKFRKHRKNFHKAKFENGSHGIKSEMVVVEAKDISGLPVLEKCLPPEPQTPSMPKRRSTMSCLPSGNTQKIVKRRATFPGTISELASNASSPPIIPRQVQKNESPTLEVIQTRPRGRVTSTDSDLVHTCLFCGKICKGYKKLEMHTLRHTKERPYFCQKPGCNTTWPTSDALYRHTQVVHRGIKYRCSACLRLFNSYDAFRKHRRDQHDGKSKMVNGKHTIKGETVRTEVKEQPAASTSSAVRKSRKNPTNTLRPELFDCLFCGKEYKEYRQLEMHMNTHTGEKPYECRECDLWFANRHDLYNHRKTNEHVTATIQSVNHTKPEQVMVEKEEVELENEKGKAVGNSSAEEASDTDDDLLVNDTNLLYDVAKWISSIHGAGDTSGEAITPGIKEPENIPNGSDCTGITNEFKPV